VALPSTSGGGDASVAKEVVYANAGANLYTFDFSLADGTLTTKASMALGGVLQFAEFDSHSKHLYAGAGAAGSGLYILHAFRIDPATGLLTEIPAPAGTAVGGSDAAAGGGSTGVMPPNGRIINLTLSRDDNYLLTVHNVTKSYTVFKLNADGTIGAPVAQADGGDMNIGSFVHQVHVDPSNKFVTICDRGNDPSTAADGGMIPEDLGHIRVFTYADGVLTPLQTVGFPNNPGYGPRHLDFHPSKPWVYVAVERANRLITYSMDSTGKLTQVFDKSSLANVADMGMLNTNETNNNGQRAGGIKVHPSGKFLWVANRQWTLKPYTDGGAGGAGDAGDAGDAAPPPPVQVWVGTGENNIALFSIDQTTGEPTFVAAADTHGFEPRTFALDPSGGYVIVGNQKKINTLTNSGLVTVNPNLSVFQVAANGTLTWVKSYDQAGEVFWEGAVTAGQ
jgi:6-phosphogluconolactonase (cycloisomerase 2 family)